MLTVCLLSVLPRLKALKFHQEFWVRFVEEMAHGKASLSYDPEELQTIISGTVMHIVQTVSDMLLPENLPTMTSNSILSVAKLCVDTQNVAFCDLIFEKMRSGAFPIDLASVSPNSQDWRNLYVQLIKPMDELLTSDSNAGISSDHFVAFFSASAEMIIGHRSLSPEDLPKLSIAIHRSKCISSLREW